jgi:hypothetical protein
MHIRSVAGVLAFLLQHDLVEVYEVSVPEEEVRCPMSYIVKSVCETKRKQYVQ